MFIAFLIAATLAATPINTQTPGVTLTYLGNMGVLLEAGERRIVVDGFHRGGLAEYAAVPVRLLEPLEGARPPFTSLTAALTTHRHKDHFDSRSVASRLTADSLVLYAGPPEVIDSVSAALPALPNRSRIRAVRPIGDDRIRIADGILGLNLPHNPTPSRRAENVGYLIEIGGLKVLHVGDADPTIENYRGQRLGEERVDIAIVPFWYLLGENDRVRQLIQPRVWVATHVPPSDTAKVRQDVLRRLTGAIVLTTPGSQHQLR